MILGISANAGAGKDTAADYLCKKHGFIKMSLADEMKRICKRVYDFSDDQLWGPSHFRNAPDERYSRYTVKPQEQWNHYIETEKSFLSPRIALQMLGTEWGRTCYENTWVDLTIRDAFKVLNSRGAYVYTQKEGVVLQRNNPQLSPFVKGVAIPDCRFRNEIEAIHANGGKVIRLRRKGIEAGKVGIVGHASEMEQLSIRDDEFDLVIDVKEGLEIFYAQLDIAMQELGL